MKTYYMISVYKQEKLILGDEKYFNLKLTYDTFQILHGNNMLGQINFLSMLIFLNVKRMLTNYEEFIIINQ
ncbi:hypothetical protein HPG69_001471 [Diceros bicornis minor]|uniref:Uncharacterized protein n=1 Tax=Diceros bicornis minor TaxID=77932 RepID=A0A7J7FFN1_DICBM|nr:hypothetical protein HPG69_001471 [Diceros bicornis minor]